MKFSFAVLGLLLSGSPLPASASPLIVVDPADVSIVRGPKELTADGMVNSITVKANGREIVQFTAGTEYDIDSANRFLTTAQSAHKQVTIDPEGFSNGNHSALGMFNYAPVKTVQPLQPKQQPVNAAPKVEELRAQLSACQEKLAKVHGIATRPPVSVQPDILEKMLDDISSVTAVSSEASAASAKAPGAHE